MRKYLFAAIAILFIGQVQGQDEEVTTLILVRHAEKAFDKEGDPVLTEEGERRAEALAGVLHEVGVDAVYSTPFKRTRLTVAPVVESKRLEVLEYNPFKLEDMIQTIEENRGKTLLISGHSNTTPAILNMLLGEDKYMQLDESDYDNLYIVYYLGVGKAKVLQLQYGELSSVE
ncbi:histidine phosphatase family protein [Fulvivirga sp. 29W222]|uniref:Histidine phosphatase family protein n=1 Tax=Fulvivirga marina TaxID=2494733 RepID=A0A937FUL1_9BACT|nr:phosphoglycerate mutase family protein [Fulvivirga marina]MBL6445222.1 histidine phosphatase family protein [Fulvivirga marina]